MLSERGHLDSTYRLMLLPCASKGTTQSSHTVMRTKSICRYLRTVLVLMLTETCGLYLLTWFFFLPSQFPKSLLLKLSRTKRWTVPLNSRPKQHLQHPPVNSEQHGSWHPLTSLWRHNKPITKRGHGHYNELYTVNDKNGHFGF